MSRVRLLFPIFSCASPAKRRIETQKNVLDWFWRQVLWLGECARSMHTPHTYYVNTCFAAHSYRNVQNVPTSTSYILEALRNLCTEKARRRHTKDAILASKSSSSLRLPVCGGECWPKTETPFWGSPRFSSRSFSLARQQQAVGTNHDPTPCITLFVDIAIM